jgi:thiamine monophosphate synthase
MYLERHLQIMQSSPFAAAPTSLYLICDGGACNAHNLRIEDFMTGALDGGACYVQYRHKNISAAAYEENLLRLIKICEGTAAVLIVNDHATLAEKFSLPLHLGQGECLAARPQGSLW